MRGNPISLTISSWQTSHLALYQALQNVHDDFMENLIQQINHKSFQNLSPEIEIHKKPKDAPWHVIHDSLKPLRIIVPNWGSS